MRVISTFHMMHAAEIVGSYVPSHFRPRIAFSLENRELLELGSLLHTNAMFPVTGILTALDHTTMHHGSYLRLHGL